MDTFTSALEPIDYCFIGHLMLHNGKARGSSEPLFGLGLIRLMNRLEIPYLHMLEVNKTN